MYPPTPTALPVAPVAPIQINASVWRIWSFTDEAIMIWNRSNDWYLGYALQMAALLVLLIFFVAYVVMLTRSLTSEAEL